MLNFKFLKTQMKNSIWITLIFTFIFVFVSIFSMSFTKYFWNTEIVTEHSIVGYQGGLDFLQMITFFGPFGEILAVIFAISLVMKLINVEVNKGYMSSWLSLPMSRTSVFTTKICTFFISSFIIVLSNLLIEFLIVAFKVAFKQYPDFTGYEVAVLIKLNFGLLLAFLFIVSVTVLFSVLFDKLSYAITLSAVVPVFFIVLFLLGNLAYVFNLSFLRYFKYFTFFSLFQYKQLINNYNLHFIWKFLLLLFFAGSMFFASFFLFKRKNLHI